MNHGAALLTSTLAVLLLGGSFAVSEKCYACGPQADPWFPTTETPPCENLTETETFQVDCGEGFERCAIGLTPNSHVVSRICSKTAAEECAIVKLGAEYSLICTCNQTLCNGEAFSEKLSKLSANMINDLDSKGIHKVHILEDDNSVSEESHTTTHADSKESAESSPPEVTPDVSKHIDDNHLPTPAAMGQGAKNGPPEDDEEESGEGSGTHGNSIIGETTTPGVTTEVPSQKSSATSARLSAHILCLVLGYFLMI